MDETASFGAFDLGLHIRCLLEHRKHSHGQAFSSSDFGLRALGLSATRGQVKLKTQRHFTAHSRRLFEHDNTPIYYSNLQFCHFCRINFIPTTLEEWWKGHIVLPVSILLCPRPVLAICIFSGRDIHVLLAHF